MEFKVNRVANFHVYSVAHKTNASLGLVVHRIFWLFTLSPYKIRRDVAKTSFSNFFYKTYQIQCKEWGFLCRDLFGPALGTGDFGHLTVEHSPMLMCRFKSMACYSSQEFEAAHKVHRQLYDQCTNHDSSASESSSRYSSESSRVRTKTYQFMK